VPQQLSEQPFSFIPRHQIAQHNVLRIHRNDASLPRIAPGMEKLTLILIIIGVALILTTCLTVLFG
jgi:hypothetical protein